MLDIFGALRAWLLSRSELTDLVSDRVYVNKLPREIIEQQDTFHPAKMLLIRMSGSGIAKADVISVDYPQLDAVCYGETDFEADRVRRVVWNLMIFALRRAFVDGVLLHRAVSTSSPVSLVDADIAWPVVQQSYNVMASTGVNQV